MNNTLNYANTVGRLFIAAIFVISGLGKVSAYAGTQAYMEAMGVPGAMLPIVIALEVLGGLAIIIGWQTRIVAFLLAGFTIVSAIVFHSDFGDQMQQISFMKNIAIAGGFLFLVANGPGALALDNRSGGTTS